MAKISECGHVPAAIMVFGGVFVFVGPPDTSFVEALHFFHQFIFCIVAGCDHLPSPPVSDQKRRPRVQNHRSKKEVEILFMPKNSGATH